MEREIYLLLYALFVNAAYSVILSPLTVCPPPPHK